jgi:hypothetical protein
MGASLVYLENPNKDIIYEEAEDSHIKYGAASMQGWRINMVSPFFHSSLPSQLLRIQKLFFSLHFFNLDQPNSIPLINS